MNDRPARDRRRGTGSRVLTVTWLTAATQLALLQSAAAGQLETGIPDLRILWDTTVKYSTAWRLKQPSATLLSDPNSDDGDRNFGKGLVSNRLDLLSEFDLYYRNVGGRISAAAWYDGVYRRGNQNDSPATANNISVPNNQFNDEVRTLHGGKAELLDAFVFGSVEVGSGSRLSARLGRHALLWGESLFFGPNGIAYGQGSFDVIKAASVPNSQFKELQRPVNQLSGQMQITPEVSLAAYLQFKWEAVRLPGVGSYFSSQSDVVGAGGERAWVPAAAAPIPNANMLRGDDIKAKNSGQGGLALRWRAGDVDYGLYATRYHDKAPMVYMRTWAPPGSGAPAPNWNLASGQMGTYHFVYPEGVRSFGGSATVTLGAVNLAGELSVRRNTPLLSDAQSDPTGTGDNSANALYAVGNSAHAQVSWLATLPPSFLSREADLLGEVAWNRVTSVTRNPAARSKNATRDATNVRMIYEPKYRQVLPGLDLSVPVGLGYGLKGNSSVVGPFYGEKVGDFSIGISGAWHDAWRFALNVTHHFGPEGTFLENGTATYKQTLKDRDFVSLSLRRTF